MQSMNENQVCWLVLSSEQNRWFNSYTEVEVLCFSFFQVDISSGQQKPLEVSPIIKIKNMSELLFELLLLKVQKLFTQNLNDEGVFRFVLNCYHFYKL